MKKRRLFVFVVAFIVACMLLAGPAGTWLQCRDMQVGENAVDAVYLAAGARHQKIRINALAAYLEELGSSGRLHILIGKDDQPGPWNREAQANLMMHEWADRRIRQVCSGIGIKDPDIAEVPGDFSGTAGEMAALSEYLSRNPEIERLLIVSSSFHLRRCVQRLCETMERHVDAYVMSAPSWEDRMPWTVLLELGKMGRDMLSLSDWPLVSRQ